MKSIKYKIIFYSDWHCGSGLAAGADVDALVVKDSDGLPYVPGKTIKGLVRQATEDYCYFANIDKSNLISETFGFFYDKDNKAKGEAFFSNAQLPDNERKAITKDLAKYLYRSIASTEIDSEGIAKEGSLRKIQVVLPCTLDGSITKVPDEFADILSISLGMIKQLGSDRNRGLGRCDFILDKGGDD